MAGNRLRPLRDVIGLGELSVRSRGASAAYPSMLVFLAAILRGASFRHA
jgi:hypothetical protein